MLAVKTSDARQENKLNALNLKAHLREGPTDWECSVAVWKSFILRFISHSNSQNCVICKGSLVMLLSGLVHKHLLQTLSGLESPNMNYLYLEQSGPLIPGLNRASV